MLRTYLFPPNMAVLKDNLMKANKYKSTRMPVDRQYTMGNKCCPYCLKSPPLQIYPPSIKANFENFYLTPNLNK